ncbi:MAG TPA: hemerythrin domain-containing protein [Trebonia sp.]
MTAQKLPGSTAARHGSGDADLTIMVAAHDALRNDLTSLARAAQDPGRDSPDRQRSVAAGWELFKRQLHLHHTAEDDLIWPALRERLGHSANALSVLDEMEAEHGRIDPLLAAVDEGFAAAAGPAGQPDADRLAGAVDGLAATLAGHLAHEEKDGLPLIGMALTAAEWRAVGFKIARQNGLAAGGEMFSWILSSAAPGQARAVARQLPPPARVLYKAVWKPRFEKTRRW